jgi:hypothetical protein
MAALAETEEEAPLISEATERKTETRSFSLRDMLHQTDNLELMAVPTTESEWPAAISISSEEAKLLPSLVLPEEDAAVPDWLQASIPTAVPALAPDMPEAEPEVEAEAELELEPSAEAAVPPSPPAWLPPIARSFIENDASLLSISDDEENLDLDLDEADLQPFSMEQVDEEVSPKANQAPARERFITPETESSSLADLSANFAKLAPNEEPAQEEAPEWLKDMLAGKPVAPVNTYGSRGRKVTSYTPMSTGLKHETSDLPEWLRESGATPAPTDFSAEMTTPEVEENPLVGLESSAPTFDTETDYNTDSVPTSMLTFLEEASEEEPSQNAAAEYLETERPEDDELLQSLFATIVPDEAEISTEEAAPDWLQEAAPPAVPVIEPPQDLPDWLHNANQSGAAPAPTDDTDLELEVAEFKLETQPEQLNLESETADFGATDFLSDSDVPSWLRTASDPPAPVPTPASIAQLAPAAEITSPGSLPAWLRAVNAGSTPVEEQNAEADVRSTFDVGLPRVEVPVALAGAGVLAALLHYEPAVAQTASVNTRAKGFNLTLLVRYLTIILLVAVTLLGLLGPINSTGRLTITPAVQSFYDQVESLTPDKKVLVVYDWQADRSGEMRPIAQTVTEHVLSKRAQLLTISLNPQGPSLAEEVTTELLSNQAYGNNQSGVYDYGKGYLNLGFVPGDEAAVQRLFTDLGELSDYRENKLASSYPIMQGLDSIAQFDQVIVLAGDETNVRTWIEQFGISREATVLIGVPSSVGPLAQPYAVAPPAASSETRGRLVLAKGLIVGLSGASQYQQLLQDKGLLSDSHVNLNQRLTTQGLGALLLIVILIVANIVYFMRKRD